MVEVIGIDHIFIAVSDLGWAEPFYDRLLGQTLGFKKQKFDLAAAPHIHYFNRHFGYVLRPADPSSARPTSGPGLHHLCLRVESIADVVAVANTLRNHGIEATEARLYPEYAADYWATFLVDPDGTRLEITNYRQERRTRHDHWPAVD